MKTVRFQGFFNHMTIVQSEQEASGKFGKVAEITFSCLTMGAMV